MISDQERIIKEAKQLLTLSELKALLEEISEEVREREWDEKWAETLASPESRAYQEDVDRSSRKV
jgi:hypothetical protein